MSEETIKDVHKILEERAKPGQPGLVLVFSGTTPCTIPFSIPDGGLELGRDALQRVYILDDRISRRHAAIERIGASLRVRDLGSTNGVFVQGTRLPPQGVVEVKTPAVLRLGRTLFLLVPELSIFEEMPLSPLVSGGIVAGPTLRTIHQQASALAHGGQGLFLRGESGSGKEVVARLFHQASPRHKGPLITVNCATIPKDLAERLLFGAVRGAYSGAVADAQGYLQAAHGGTLFLDEVAELELSVQAKLLRVLETREVTPLGSTRPQQVELGLCAATLRNLREAVTSGAFREDLYYRIGRPELVIPPLRERQEEIPFLADMTARSVGSQVNALFVEACLMRPWPGNVRELCSEVRAAAALARAGGHEIIEPEHLTAQAGQLLTPPRSDPNPSENRYSEPAPPPEIVPEAILRIASETLGLAHKTLLKLFQAGTLTHLARSMESTESGPERDAMIRESASEALLRLLDVHEYNQSAIASALGMSRTTLLKLMAELRLPRASDLDPEQIAQALRAAGGDQIAAARTLRVSVGALRKRLASR